MSTIPKTVLNALADCLTLTAFPSASLVRASATTSAAKSERRINACVRQLANIMIVATETYATDNGNYRGVTIARLHAIETDVGSAQCGVERERVGGRTSGGRCGGRPGSAAYCVETSYINRDGTAVVFGAERRAGTSIHRYCAPKRYRACSRNFKW